MSDIADSSEVMMLMTIVVVLSIEMTKMTRNIRIATTMRMLKNIRKTTTTTFMAMMMVMVIKMMMVMMTTTTIVMVNFPGSYLR